jgi:hypothetical protein
MEKQQERMEKQQERMEKQQEFYRGKRHESNNDNDNYNERKTRNQVTI